jgi:hypothetical protein
MRFSMSVTNAAPEATSNALLASLVLRTLDEMRRTAKGEAGYPHPTSADLERLVVLQQLILASWRGAAEMHEIVEGERLPDDRRVPMQYHMPPTEGDDLTTYDLVQRLRGNGRSINSLIDFASGAVSVLKKLHDDRVWRLSPDEEKIVTDQLMPFLRRLRAMAEHARHRAPEGFEINRF